MNIAIVQQLIEQASHHARSVELIWHGGEPLLVGIDYFKQIVALQHSIELSRGVRFRNLIQTNAVLINDDWADLFKQHEFGVGISLDGPEWLHNKTRTYLSGKGSYKQVLQGVKNLQAKNVGFGVLAVVSKGSLNHAQELFDFFVDQGVKKFDFLPCVEIQRLPLDQTVHSVIDGSLAEGDFSRFMSQIFDLWIERDDPDIHIRYLENMITGLLGYVPSLCKFNGSCKDYVTIMHDGQVLPCDNFVGYNELVFGNIKEHPLETILDGDRRKRFMTDVSIKRPECLRCEYLHACGGGCNKYSYMWNRSFQDKNYFCGDRWRLFTYISDFLQREHYRLPLRLATDSRWQPIALTFQDTLTSGLSDRSMGNQTEGYLATENTPIENCSPLSSGIEQHSVGKRVLDRIASKLEARNSPHGEWSDWDNSWDRGWDRDWDRD